MLVLIGACASSARFPAPRSGGRRAVGQASGCLTVSGTRTIRGTVTYAGRERYGITAHENRKCARRGNCKNRACRLDATSVRCRQKRAGSTKSVGWMSTAGDSEAGLLRIRSAFDAPFQFAVRRDERSAIGACHRLIVFQHFRIDQCGTETNSTSEFVHRAIRTPHRCLNK
jgi:hypothetical protein